MDFCDEKARAIAQYLRGDVKGSGLTEAEVDEWFKEVQRNLGMVVDEYLDEENACPYDGDVYKYIDLAESASSRRRKKVYLEKARFLDPENLDVLYAWCLYEHRTSEEAFPYVKELLEKEKAKLEEKGYYERAKGRFAHFRETQPYVRGLMGYMVLAEDCGLIHKAMAAGEKILMLCEEDIEEDSEAFQQTYDKLMYLYAFLEEKDKMLHLLEEMDEDIRDSESYLLPLALLYYKLGEWDKASQYVKEVQKGNKQFKKFISLYLSEQVEEAVEDMVANPPLVMGEPGTMSELLEAYRLNTLTFITNAGFFTWAKGQLGRRKKA